MNSTLVIYPSIFIENLLNYLSQLHISRMLRHQTWHQGAYGEVYLVKWRGTEVAAKTIRSSIASNQMVK